MTRIAINMVLVGAMVTTAILTGCSSESDDHRQVLDRIVSTIQRYNEQLTEMKMKCPSEAIVHLLPMQKTSKSGVAEQGESSSSYWIYKDGSFSEISNEDAVAYQKDKVKFNGKSGDYFYFSFFLFDEDEGGQTRGGVLFLPDGNRTSLELTR
jgi:outer membrane murein-binding lipoprotein Lpp